MSVLWPKVYPLIASLKRFSVLLPCVIMFATHHAWAKPLSSEECAKLVSEHADLEKKNIETRMDQDPAIAVPLLKPDQLAEIERFLHIEGEIRFRCPEIKLAVPAPPMMESDSEAPITTSDKKQGAVNLNGVQDVREPKGPPVPLPRRKPSPPAKRAG